MKSKEIQLRNKKNNFLITFRFDDFPYFGIWSVPGANFICLEPWCGIADHIHHTQDITQKEGIIALNKYETFCRSWSVVIEQ